MARPALEQNGPPDGHVRLYRGERATRVTNIPEWMQANQGGWFTSDLAMAQGYAQGGRLVAVDVPEHIAEQWKAPSKDAQVQGRGWSTSCPRTLPGWQWRSLPDCRPIISGQDLTCQRMTLVMTSHWTDPAGCPSHPPPLR